MADPFWTRVATPLAKRILRLIQPAGPTPPAVDDAPYILEETIETVLADGRYVIGGNTLTTKGRARLREGQRVHVLWEHGRRKLILTHQWQRAQGGTPELVGYAVEELLLIEADTTAPDGARWDVYFRNDQQVTRLNLQTIINADRVPAADWSFSRYGVNQTGVVKIGWGQTDNTFWVMTLAARTPLAFPIIYYPRFYTFRLSRAEGEPAGGARVSASRIATVDLPVFQLPAKYNDLGYPDAIAAPATFPHLGGDELRQAEIVLEPAGTVVMVVAHVVTNAYTLAGGLVPRDLEQIAYLFAVRAGTPSILWESPIPDQYRASPAPAVPELPQSSDNFNFTNSQYLVRLDGFVVLEWSAADPGRRRIATAWDVFKGTIHQERVTPGPPPPAAVVTVNHARRAVFVEDGTVLPVATIQGWTDYQIRATSAGFSAIPFVEATPTRGLARPGQPNRLLLTGTRYTSVSPEPVIQEGRIELWDGSAVLTVLGLEEPNGDLVVRADALRLLPARTTYAIAEAASSPAWPPAGERTRFVLLTGARPLDVGKPLVADGAHQGPLAALPAGVTAPDGQDSGHFAYHVVGTIT